MAEHVHPLAEFDANIYNVKCFDESGSGRFRFAPITFVIGKNNSGKSTILDALQALSNDQKLPNLATIQRAEKGAVVEVAAPPDVARLKRLFPTSSRNGSIPGNHWETGKRFLDKELIWEIGGGLQVNYTGKGWNEEKLSSEVLGRLTQAAFTTKLSEKGFLKISAEREVKPEIQNAGRKIDGNGTGLTNLIRAFINSDALPRQVVETELLSDLNEIYLGDSHFNGILCQENDARGEWEIFLREEGKGDIRLSQSGSSLKTVFIVAAFIRLLPHIDNKLKFENTIFCVEEPENNLHPALLRRLLEFLAKRRNEKGFSLVVTTHSPICIDWSTRRDDTTILHVKREANGTTCQNVLDYKGHAGILDDLDVRGSDILQSNGVIWVEGPSDRIYINKWIELISGGNLKENAHYNFLYYGGKILSHFSAQPTPDAEHLIRMLLINRNVAVVMDSDRRWGKTGKRKPRLNLNKTKKRIISEVDKIGGYSWVTQGKEIENYVPKTVWDTIAGSSLAIQDEYVDVPAIAALKTKYATKIALGHAAEKQISLDDIQGHLDLQQRVEELCHHIRIWNAMN